MNSLEDMKQWYKHLDKIKSSAAQFKQHILPHVARALLLATFFEDGIRVAMQYDAQHQFISVKWAAVQSWRPATWLIALTVLGQVLPALSILARRAVLANCVFLVFILGYHSVLYHSDPEHLNVSLTPMNLAILGGLLLLAAETQTVLNSVRTIIVGLPQLEARKDKKSRTVLLLAGRVLLPMMLLTLVHLQQLNNSLRVLELVVASLLMFCVAIGFKARQCALALALWLFMANLVLNAWWQFHPRHPYREFAKFDFFQTLSVVGGLLLLFHHGPGHASVDEYNKKAW